MFMSDWSRADSGVLYAIYCSLSASDNFLLERGGFRLLLDHDGGSQQLSEFWLC